MSCAFSVILATLSLAAADPRVSSSATSTVREGAPSEDTAAGEDAPEAAEFEQLDGILQLKKGAAEYCGAIACGWVPTIGWAMYLVLCVWGSLDTVMGVMHVMKADAPVLKASWQYKLLMFGVVLELLGVLPFLGAPFMATGAAIVLYVVIGQLHYTQ